jgi:putative endonuclease
MKRQRAERGGRRAEAKAALWLQLKGWRIMGRRVRTPVGEVDLIARRGRTIAFVEVKARATAKDADRALDDYRLRRVAAAAGAIAHKYARDGEDIRIDAIFIIPRRLPRHLANVWIG